MLTDENLVEETGWHSIPGASADACKRFLPAQMKGSDSQRLRVVGFHAQLLRFLL